MTEEGHNNEPQSGDLIDIECQQCGGPQKATMETFDDGRRLIRCHGCKAEAEIPAPPKPEEQGVPTSANSLAWAEIHPVLRQVVITSLKESVAKFEHDESRTSAQMLAMMAAMGEMAGSLANSGSFEGASMGVGMSAAMDQMGGRIAQSQAMSRKAIGHAFSTAIRELEKA